MARWPRSKPQTALLLGLAAAKLGLQFYPIRQYGYFRDELYYLASTRHLSWGYVEHPPLSIWILSLQRALFGDGLVALRVLPAFAGAAKVVAIALLARSLGGGTLAMAVAGVAALCAPEYLGTDHLYSMNTWDQLVWVLAAWALVGTLRRPSTRKWILFGVLLGLGLLNKISVLWLGAGILAGMVLTPQRRLLRTRGPYLAGALAAVLFAPYLVWQAAHGWPLLEFMHNARTLKMVRTSPLALLGGQVLTMNPLSAPIALAGLLFLLFGPGARPYRYLGWAYLTVLVILLSSRTSRPSYLALAYPLLLAPGAVWLGGLRRARQAIAGTALVLLLASGALLAPYALPLLSPDGFLRYQAAIGVRAPESERSARAALPQHFADMFGWDEFAAKVSQAYAALDPEERAHCAVFGQNYGEAGAIDVIGRRYGLPAAISGHNSYWIWGPGSASPTVMIVIGGNEADHRRVFDSVTIVGRVDCERCMPYEQGRTISVCRGLRVPLPELWPRLKHYI